VSANPLLAFSPFYNRVLTVLPENIPVFLVGGAIRDALLGKTTHDLDFVLPERALTIGRHVANALGGVFYILDEARQIGRVIYVGADKQRYVIDFAMQRGPDLQSDLRGRDFTINAMAIDIKRPDVLVDPLKGATDLLEKRLCACSSTSMIEDPLRVMRGVRLAVEYGLKIVAETRQQMRQAAPALTKISQERIRDELFRILGGVQPATALRTLDILGGVALVLPELTVLKEVDQSPPHVSDVWNHTLDIVQKLEMVLATLAPQCNSEASANLATGLVSLRLGRYRQNIHAHLEQCLNPDRSLRQIIFFSALYHDAGKSITLKREKSGRIRFLGHDLKGVEMVSRRAQELRLSSLETERLVKIVRHHMRPMLLRQASKVPSRRAIYRFFRDCGETGVDICLLSIADVLATYGSTLPQDLWQKHLDVVRVLLDAWWGNPRESILPPLLVNGDDIMRTFNLSPGPQVGKILETIREAQAVGNVRTPAEAIAIAQSILCEKK